jgi:hypothetical protein
MDDGHLPQVFPRSSQIPYQMHSRLQFFLLYFKPLLMNLKTSAKILRPSLVGLAETSLKLLATSVAKLVIFVLTVLTRQPLNLRTLGKMFLLLMEIFLWPKMVASGIGATNAVAGKGVGLLLMALRLTKGLPKLLPLLLLPT